MVPQRTTPRPRPPTCSPAEVTARAAAVPPALPRGIDRRRWCRQARSRVRPLPATLDTRNVHTAWDVCLQQGFQEYPHTPSKQHAPRVESRNLPRYLGIPKAVSTWEPLQALPLCCHHPQVPTIRYSAAMPPLRDSPLGAPPRSGQAVSEGVLRGHHCPRAADGGSRRRSGSHARSRRAGGAGRRAHRRLVRGPGTKNKRSAGRQAQHSTCATNESTTILCSILPQTRFHSMAQHSKAWPAQQCSSSERVWPAPHLGSVPLERPRASAMGVKAPTMGLLQASPLQALRGGEQATLVALTLPLFISVSTLPIRAVFLLPPICHSLNQPEAVEGTQPGSRRAALSPRAGAEVSGLVLGTGPNQRVLVGGGAGGQGGGAAARDRLGQLQQHQGRH